MTRVGMHPSEGKAQPPTKMTEYRGPILKRKNEHNKQNKNKDGFCQSSHTIAIALLCTELHLIEGWSKKGPFWDCFKRGGVGGVGSDFSWEILLGCFLLVLELRVFEEFSGWAALRAHLVWMMPNFPLPGMVTSETLFECFIQ